MEERKLCVYVPQETETLREYFERYTDEELRNILTHPELSKQVCSYLLEETFLQDLSEPEEQFQNLWQQIKNFDNYGRLRHFVRILTPARQKLLKSLEETANQLEQYTKYGSISRLMFSATDIIGTVGGLWMQNSSHDYSSYAFPAGTACGFFNMISSITELYLSENAKNDILNLLRRDQTLFTPIECWFQQAKMLHIAMLNIFPFELTRENVKDFIDEAQSDLSRIGLLMFCLRTALERDIHEIRNGKWVNHLITFIKKATVQDICNWLIFQHNPVVFDIGRVLLQLQYSNVNSALFQCIPALNSRDQNLWSIPVWGRISLNFVTMLQSIKTLRKPEISYKASEMRRLKDELKAEMDVLEKIISYCDSKS